MSSFNNLFSVDDENGETPSEFSDLDCSSSHVFYTRQSAVQLMRLLSNLQANHTDLTEDLSSIVYKTTLHTDTVELTTSLANIEAALFTLKYSALYLFSQLIELTVVHNPGMFKPYKIVYLFLSLQYNSRIIVTTKSAPLEQIPSICYMYLSANWLEREVWDMFGCWFHGHPNLRRILTDYGFK